MGGRCGTRTKNRPLLTEALGSDEEMMQNDDAVAVTDFVLYDLCRPSLKYPKPFQKSSVLIHPLIDSMAALSVGVPALDKDNEDGIPRTASGC